MENILIENNDIDSLGGVEFEQLIMTLLRNMGLQVTETKKTGDGGVDIIAQSLEFITGGVYVIQCKRYSGNIGEPIIRDLYGVVHHMNASKGILITNSDFTRQARDFAENKPIELINGHILKKMLSKYEVKDIKTDDSIIYVYNKSAKKFVRSVISLFDKLESMKMTDSSLYDLGKSVSLSDFLDMSVTTEQDMSSLVSILDLMTIDNYDDSNLISLRTKAIKDIVNNIVKKRKAIIRAKVQMISTTDESKKIIRELKQAAISLFDSIWMQLFSLIKDSDRSMSEMNGTLVPANFSFKFCWEIDIPKSIYNDYQNAIMKLLSI